MARFSIVTTCFNEYEILRQLVESVLCNVNKETYDKLIIADDCSALDSKLRKYLEYLDATYDFIEVVLESEARISPYNNKEGGKEPLSYGPIVNLLRGVERVKTEFTLNVDCDIIFLKKSYNLLTEMAAFFDTNSNVVTMGQMMGEKKAYTICNNPGDYWLEYVKYGSVSPMANALRMEPFHKKLIDFVPEARTEVDRYLPLIAGWNTAYLNRGIFKHNFSTLNFPLFSDCYLLHIGGGIVDLQVDGRKIRKFAYVNNFEGRYGGKGGNIINDWYSGRLIINKTHDEYLGYLRNRYSVPFDVIQPFDESIVKLID